MLTFKLAFRNILRQRRRSLLTGLSIAGGYILFSFVLSLIDGSYSNAIAFFTADHTGHIQIHRDDYEKRPKIHKTIDLTDELTERLNSHPRVAGFAPRIFSPALAYGSEKTTPTMISNDVPP